MSNKIRFVELQELCNSITDCHHSTPLYIESGKIVIRNFNIKKGRLQLDDISYTDEENYLLRTSRAIPEVGDLIITREAPMGEVCIIPENLECCLGQRMVLLKPNHNKVDSNYLLYTLMSQYVQTQISKSEGTGSIVSNLRIPVLKELHIPIYDIERQVTIGKILSDIDSKIALNNRINAELEAMAKTVYDYWFVQFDFPFDFAQGKPSAEGKSYKSSGGKMVWCEELKREVPEGWEVGELKDIANITMGQSPAGESYNEDGNGMVFYQGCTDFGTRFPTIRKYTTEPTRFARQGDILLSVRAPVGTLNIAKEDCCIGRGLAALNSKDNCITYLFGVMVNLKQIFDRRNTDGTTFGSITKDDLFTLKVIKPRNEVLEMYHKLINPCFEKQNLIAEENQQLSSLRDWLLPMLMNGQVRPMDIFE